MRLAVAPFLLALVAGLVPGLHFVFEGLTRQRLGAQRPPEPADTICPLSGQKLPFGLAPCGVATPPTLMERLRAARLAVRPDIMLLVGYP